MRIILKACFCLSFIAPVSWPTDHFESAPQKATNAKPIELRNDKKGGKASRFNRLVAFSSDGGLLLRVNEIANIEYWDVRNAQHVQTVETNTAFLGRVEAIAISSSTKVMAISSGDMEADDPLDKKQSYDKKWSYIPYLYLRSCFPDVEMMRIRLPGRGTVLAVSTDDERIAVGGNKGEVWVLDVKSGRTIGSFHGTGEIVDGVSFSNDGAQLCTVSKLGMRWFDLSTWKEARSFVCDESIRYTSVGFTPDGRNVLTGNELYGAWDNLDPGAVLRVRKILGSNLRVWDRATGNFVSVLTPHATRIERLVVREGRTHFATCCNSGKAVVWSAAEQKVLCICGDDKDWIDCVSLSHDGKKLAICLKDDLIKVWDLADLCSK